MLLFPEVGLAQNSAEKLRESREKTLKEIEYANKLLLETQGQTKKSLSEITIINHRLAKRKEYLIGLEVEVNVISLAMLDNHKAIASIEEEIVKLKRIYALMIVNLYKNKSENYRIMYFFASENLNQLYKRISTVRIFNSFLRNQKFKLDQLIAEMDEKNKELNNLLSSKDILFKETKSETITIQKEINQKNGMVQQLKKKQKEIEEDIRKKEKTARKLETELKRIIEAERKKVSASGNKEVITADERILSTDFEKNIGRLPWPTRNGIITGQYGEHKHPDYKSVTIRNDGVYISTSTGESARAIFKGNVSKVFSIPGENYTVIIKHGQFYTLYHNLVDVKVKAGQVVNVKEAIGTVFTNENTNETVLYFQIWKETERKDPEIWLAPS